MMPSRTGRKDGEKAPTETGSSAAIPDLEEIERHDAPGRELQALRRSEAVLRDFIESSTVCLHWVGADGVILWANEAELDLLGYGRDEYVGQNIAAFHADEPVINDIICRLGAGETLRDYPARLRHRDGSERHVLINSSALFEDGKFVHTRCFTRDVTALRQEQESSLLLSAIVDSSDDAIVSKDLTGRITSWNRGAERIFGYTAEEAVGQSITILIPPDRLEEEPEILARLQRGERVDHFETIRRRKDGTWLHISLTISPVKDRQGRIVGASKIARDITELKRAQELRAQLSAIVESSADAMYIYDFDGRILTWNRGAEELYGYTRDEIVGRNIGQVVPPDLRAELDGIITPAVKAGKILRNLETTRQRRNCEAFPALLTISPIRDESGRAVAVSVIARDVTDEKRAEEKLNATTAKFESVFNQSGIFAGIVDLQGYLREVNVLAVTGNGYKREQVLDQLFWETLWWRGDREVRDRVRFATQQAASGQVFRETLRYWTADGTERLVDFAMHPIRDEAGRVRFLHPTGVDITERERARRALQESEEKYRDLFESIDQGFCFIEVLFDENEKPLDYKFLLVNPAFERQTGIANATGRRMREIAPLHEEYWFQTYGQIALTGEPRHFENQASQLNRYYDVFAWRVGDPRERKVAILFNNITRRKQTEESLRSSEERFRQLADAMPQMVWTARPDGFMDYYNARWYEFTGLTSNDLGDKFTAVLHPDDVERCLTTWYGSVKSGEPYQIEYRFRDRGENRWRWFMGRALAARDAEGHIVKWFGTSTDIDEQKHNEDELRRANQDLEQFAYSASHDLQEPLRTIKIYSELLAHRHAAVVEGESGQFLEFLQEGATRMEMLVRDLLAYTQVSRLAPPFDAADANEALTAALANLGGAIAESGALVTSDALPLLRVHSTHMRQVFQNLIGNAIKYRNPDRAPTVHISAERLDASWVFMVRDNGIGIEPQYKEQIFGLFTRLHTTDRYTGTGIGLAICQRIVERYHGRIWVESEPGRGSDFRFSFPA